MKHAPTATRVIWRTVVFAGAMLASPACSTSSAPAAARPVEEPAPAPPEAAELAEPTTPPATVTEPEVAKAEPAPPAPAPRIEVTVTSKPAGATVYVGDEPDARGQTPMTIELDQAADGVIELRIERDGYATENRMVKTDAGSEVAVTMQKVKRPRGGGGGGTGRGFILA